MTAIGGIASVGADMVSMILVGRCQRPLMAPRTISAIANALALTAMLAPIISLMALVCLIDAITAKGWLLMALTFVLLALTLVLTKCKPRSAG